MATYTVFESVNMGSTHYAERIFDAIAETDIENGTFGYLDGLADGEDVVYNFKAGTKSGLVAGDIVVVDQPVWTEDDSRRVNQRKDKFVIEAGTRFRVRVVKKNDEFGITAEGFTSSSQSIVVDETDFVENVVYATIDATTGKLVASKTATADAIMEAQIMRKRVAGGKLVTVSHDYGYARNIYEAKIISLA